MSRERATSSLLLPDKPVPEGVESHSEEDPTAEEAGALSASEPSKNESGHPATTLCNQPTAQAQKIWSIVETALADDTHRVDRYANHFHGRRKPSKKHGNIPVAIAHLK